ncbi:hypothetical protein IMSHALPRED_009721 [Imshaugia aleurites]|uniref:Uncharacterized protein n=1 Tax=Imshaugia aleurites TaxID=172621 RepID=A0A8H3G4I6_9LECA|nr:hypothetical protein IMSHALPRED_009721 [Imshaugia aleurites]
MCSECGQDGAPICDYCGDACFGRCGNPDACRSCWLYNSFPEFEDYDDDDELDKCIEESCACHCHEALWDDMEYRFDAGVRKCFEEHGPPYERQGVFPFLKLPGEIREKIYGYSFLQYGKQRRSPSHSGSIHTALLGTCRQIYNEAGHLPLTINKLCFGSPLFAHDFFGFQLAPTQRDLVTGMHIEFHMGEFSSSSWQLLMRELVKMPINHLGLTVKGGVPKEHFSGHTCFTNRFKVLKGLKTFDLILASAFIKDEDKKGIQEEMREKLIKDYARPKDQKKSKAKRVASTDVVAGSGKATKKAKKANTSVSIETSEPLLVRSELTLECQNKTRTKLDAPFKSSRLNLRYQKLEGDTAKAAKRAQQILLEQYNQLKQFATALDPDAAPVKIRLEQARKAAQAIDEPQFEKLAHGIFLTLDERYSKIAAARKDLPTFGPFRTPFPSSNNTS